MNEITLYAECIRTVVTYEAASVRYTVDGKRLIQEICRRADLKISEWNGEIAILPFTDIDGNFRIITMRLENDGRVKFTAYSCAVFPRGKVPQAAVSVIREVAGRHGRHAQWEICSAQNLSGFSFSISLSWDGLDGPFTNWVCRQLLLEVGLADNFLRAERIIE